MQMETVTEDTPMGGNGRKIALEGGFFYKEQELGLVTAWIPPPPPTSGVLRDVTLVFEKCFRSLGWNLFITYSAGGGYPCD